MDKKYTHSNLFPIIGDKSIFMMVFMLNVSILVRKV